MTTRINDPGGYYRDGEAPSLFWELTVCQSLASLDSPYQAALDRPARYGELLAGFLTRETGLDPGWRVLEVGGGYGTLMAAFLDRVPLGEVTLVDIAPFFTERQRSALAGRAGCRFVSEDVFAFLAREEAGVDLVVSNENLGDLPTVIDIRREDLERALARGGAGGPLGAVAEKVRRYGLDLGDAPEEFAFNLGAIRYVELLAARARVVFLSEHGADTVLPPAYAFLPLETGDGYPRRIRLKGHDEYSIRFGHLERVASALGYSVRRFHMAELLGLRRDEGIRAMARVSSTASEVAEAVHEFCTHVAEYQCMVLEREE